MYDQEEEESQVTSGSGRVTYQNPAEDTDNDQDDDFEEPVRTRGKANDYNMFCSFRTLQEAKAAVSNKIDGNKWKYKNPKELSNGYAIWYNCCDPNCDVKLKIMSNQNSSTTTISIQDLLHQHDEEELVAANGNIKFTQDTLDKIILLEGLGQKPEKILIELRKARLQIPPKPQLTKSNTV